MRLFGLITSILSQISHQQSHFESLRQYYFGTPYAWGSKVTPKTGVIFWKRFNSEY